MVSKVVSARSEDAPKTESKHTPGPWVIRRGASVADSDGFGVAACGGYYNSEIDPADLLKIQAANARLIAAAPDMLAALDEIDSGICKEMSAIEAGEYSIGQVVDLLVYLQNTARAAIAKAKGV